MRYRKKCHRNRKWWAGIFPFFFILAASAYVLASSNVAKDTVLDAAIHALQANLGYQAVQRCMPLLTYDGDASKQKSIYEYLAASMDELLPIYGYARKQNSQVSMGRLGLPGEEESCSLDGIEIAAQLGEEGQEAGNTMETGMDTQGSVPNQETAKGQGKVPATQASSGKVQKFSREKLNDFDYLIQNFYRVDSTTTTNGNQLNAAKMLEKDMRIDPKQEGPQILIYHTHSQEGYVDSKGEAQSVLGLGDYLTQLLEETYGYRVLHHRGKYDIPDRDTAYSRSGPALEQLLKDYPSIQVIIDLHRDGVAEGTHLVETVNGKQTASIMFFNGLSHTTAQGDIGYLYNPNLADNLAFSFQMQLAAMEYYPGLSRCIYLSGYRYNLHYLPKSLLVEVGAQTNTFEEAKNAMPPLADILDKVLSGKAK